MYPPGNKLIFGVIDHIQGVIFFFTTVEVLKHGHQFYDAPPTEKKSSIPSTLNTSEFVPVLNQQNTAEVILHDISG